MGRWVVMGMVLLLWCAPAFAKRPARAPHAPRQVVGRGVELEPGWHEGPFIIGGVGMMNTDHDDNIITGEHFGHDYAQSWTVGLGWNVTDTFGAELLVHFADPRAPFDGEIRSEFAGQANLGARYAFIRPWCFLGHHMKVLPYIKGGGVIYAIAVRGAERAEGKAGGLGTGLSVGGGLEFNFGRKPASFMIDLSIDETFMFMDRKFVSGVEVTNGKFDDQFSAHALFGVHF